ncbi:NAD-dependent epimerase/dehydratase family protein [Streptomyces inhibens]|uniref:NAD-dependent epimerase/dehydratase family protein n=1 Tax=Streptomyces inhibens TaxID=2293571 RepID=A0A371Q4H9_STRIH|nr:NAD-dependent epimerase/dehydratase family protein [Streptomyces inhibens]REK89616.1 NAD-dependent epimerase/dehydratase family protein [Streptomyces inhibens]
MRVFLTGATGYIGGSVADLLLRSGHQVEGLVRTQDKAGELERRGITPVFGTLDDGALLTARARAADAVVNAANSDHRGAVEALVEGLAGTGRPLVHTSGSSIVSTNSRGAAADEIFTEKMIVDRGSSWQPVKEKAARVALDRFVLDAAGNGVRSVVLCNSLVYGHGRGMARDSVQIPVLARQARDSGVVRYVEEGRNIWSTVHIDDMADLYLRALTDAPAGSFYFVENGEVSFADICTALASALGLGPAESWDADTAVAFWGHELALYVLASNSRVRSGAAQLGWRPAHSSVLDWIEKEYLHSQ